MDEVQKVRFSDEDALRELFTYLEAIPVRVNGEVKIISWSCGPCTQSYKHERRGDCRGDIWGTAKCQERYSPDEVRPWFRDFCLRISTTIRRS